MNLSNAEIAQLNEFNNLLSFKVTEQYKLLMSCKSRFIVNLSGNQGGKTAGTGRQYVDRFLGLHPIAEKNCDYFVCENGHKQAILTAPPKSFEGEGRCRVCEKKLEFYCDPPYLRVFRFASHNLPGTAGGDAQEVRNTQYPEIKKWLPQFLIKKDINSRYPVLTIKDINGGPDILVEFVSYGQDVQATAGPQRCSLWADEQPNFDFMEEQYPRLLAANGDVIFSLTAADRISWLYDEYYEKASEIFRTDNVVNAPVVKELFGTLEKYEKRNTGKDITVIQFATDDNPTLKKESIDDLFRNIDDPATLARRRYGMFAQASGRVLKSYNQSVHFISENKWFQTGIPESWVYARGIDYHQRNDWHFLAMALSPENELFIYHEKRLSPEVMTTYEMAHSIALATGQDVRFMLSMIDPLANQIQGNTGYTTIQDLNKYFSQLKRDGIGTGGYWTPWDTKSLRGREQLRLRLKNSLQVQKPFNNSVKTEKGIVHLPTIWVLDSCPHTAQYLRMWRHEENKGRDDSANKDEKETVAQKWSHFPMVIEGILKEKSFRPKIGDRMLFDRNTESHQYFNAGRMR